ncbi:MULTISPECIES: hypothetical protein [Vibrio harveyi group]|uniref:hypothetical protein n=1 Tax=Vibrio harveyi group TaxID=717610 RepID=UPI00224D8511|nr:hypothetical protein [Vibrio parahaemolyticus]MCX4117686.1 hypothetical protein [Vibrio parahaemolyticus]HCM0709862.1 hypothetical protein [Vibrio parahaemolyticus]
MKVTKDVQDIINKINSGALNSHLEKLDSTDFGVYLPIFEDKGTIKKMLDGYSQVERDLVVSVRPNNEDDNDALPIGWFGGLDGKDSACRHKNQDKCKHCTSHGGKCRHCTHEKNMTTNGFDAPELDYPNTVKSIEDKADLLEKLAKEGLGLTLLHGHSDKYMFTKLPPEYVSVVVDGKTEFRLASEVELDSTFIPNAWRLIKGELKVAGGHSQLINE